MTPITLLSTPDSDLLPADVDATDSSADTPPSFPLTDLGNAERLIADHGINLRFATHAGWLHWTGTHWRRDDTGEVQRLAAATIRRLYGGLESIGDSKTRDTLYRHLTKSEGLARLQAMQQLAQFLPGVPVTADELDTDPMLFNLMNGTLNLTTGDLQPHRRQDLLTLISPIHYDSAARCPRWQEFLAEVLGDDGRVLAYTQRLVGYLLTGDRREHVIIFLTGRGANGKSALLDVLRSLLGRYAKSTSFATFLERRDSSTSDLAALAGARLVTATEADGGGVFHEALLKQVSGGDPVTARNLYRDPFTFTPTFTVCFATNDVPRIRSQHHAMRRRLHVLRFPHTFYTDGRDPHADLGLPAALHAELPGILSWAVQGCLAWQHEGLNPPRAVRDATDQLMADNDSLGDFLDECGVFGPNEQVPVAVTWSTYLRFCEMHDARPAFRQVQGLSQSLCQRDGVEVVRGHGGVRRFVGFGLQEVTR